MRRNYRLEHVKYVLQHISAKLLSFHLLGEISCGKYFTPSSPLSSADES